MAGKLASIPVFSLQRCMLAAAALILVSFSFFSLRSLRSPQQTQNQYPSHLSSSDSPTNGRYRLAPLSSSSIYHSQEIFRANYAEMDTFFKVYIYPDGDPDSFYQTPRKLTGKYASEGYFFQNIRDSKFRTEDPDQAHLFFIPISCHKMRGNVQKHFEWHSPPVPFDAFHMVMHELWLRRHVIKY